MPFRFEVQQFDPLRSIQAAESMDTMRMRREALRDQLAERQALQRLGPAAMAGDADALNQLGRNPRALSQVQEALSKMDETRRGRLKEQTDFLGRAAHYADTPEKWDAAIDEGMRLGIPGLEQYKGKFSPGTRQWAIARTAELGKLFELSPEAQDAAARGEAKKYNATLPGRMAVAHAGRSVNNTQVVMQGEKEFEKKYMGSLGDEAAKIHPAAEAARNTLSRLTQLQSLMRDFETGKLAPARSTAAAWAQALGVSPEVMQRVGLNPSDAVNGQSINAITNTLMISLIGTGGFPANNFSDADRAFLQTTVPQLATTPGANQIITQSMKAAAERNIEKERKWLDARKRGRSFEDFNREWSEYAQSTPLFRQVQNVDEYNKLPSGSIYTDPQGVVRTKP